MTLTLDAGRRARRAFPILAYRRHPPPQHVTFLLAHVVVGSVGRFEYARGFWEVLSYRLRAVTRRRAASGSWQAGYSIAPDCSQSSRVLTPNRSSPQEIQRRQHQHCAKALPKSRRDIARDRRRLGFNPLATVSRLASPSAQQHGSTRRRATRHHQIRHGPKKYKESSLPSIGWTCCRHCNRSWWSYCCRQQSFRRRLESCLRPTHEFCRCSVPRVAVVPAVQPAATFEAQQPCGCDTSTRRGA